MYNLRVERALMRPIDWETVVLQFSPQHSGRSNSLRNTGRFHIDIVSQSNFIDPSTAPLHPVRIRRTLHIYFPTDNFPYRCVCWATHKEIKYMGMNTGANCKDVERKI